jgi:mycobactin lysine-N-oxygenase
MAKSLALIGAGPKSMAIAAKTAALKACGYSVPELFVIEPSGVGAHWTGLHGYTDGTHVLGTAPEKDVGFPYNSGLFESVVDQYMLANFSFPAFRIAEWQSTAMRDYGDEIDRGTKGETLHSKWARYLSWVKDNAKPRMIEGRIVALAVDGHSWRITYRPVAGPDGNIVVDGVVFTGPGPAKKLPGQPPNQHSTITDGVDFWQRLQEFEDLDPDQEPIGVIGSGETAASVVVALAGILKNPVPIRIINRQGAIFSRGEGYFENRLYTEPENWEALPFVERREIIRRTDRGVISQQAISFINQLRNVDHWRLSVNNLVIDTTYDPVGRPWVFGEFEVELQRAVVAVGFDPWWFVSLVQDKLLKGPLLQEAYKNALVENIQHDLSFKSDQLPTAKLHVPMLAGLAQGPGFPNLSCLGHLADRILDSYVSVT